MVDLFDRRDDEQDARIALLRYYSSECVTHGTYILTIAVLIFTSLEVYTRITLLNETATNLVFSFILSFLFTMGFYLLMRLILWGYLITPLMWIKPLTYEKAAEKLKCVQDKASVNLMIRLHLACGEFVKRAHKTVSKYAHPRHEWLVLFVICFFVFAFGVFPLLESQRTLLL